MAPADNSRVNDFVMKIATVNGTGSASANALLMKSIFRSGIPVVGKNYFPSNIQGLPTWYEIRVSEAGYTGRRGTVDLMVAMNPQTYREDVDAIAHGGWLLYDASKPLARELRRPDVTLLGIPLTEMMVREFSNPRQRLLFKNVGYVGALTALLDLEVAVVEQLIHEQFRGKEKLIPANLKALHMGRTAALNASTARCPSARSAATWSATAF